MRYRIKALLGIYLISIPLNFSALNAMYRHAYIGDDVDARMTCGFSLFMALTPPGAIVIPLFTGLYAAGNSFNCNGENRYGSS